MKKKGLLIIIPVILVIGVMFFLGVRKYNDSFNNFQYDGFVIDNTTNTTSSSYYFNKDAKYKVSPTRNEVKFDNTDNEEVSISDDSFLHFNDGSIGVFKKSVVLNLEELSEPVLHYYNVYDGSIFTKTGNAYQINYLNQKLNFSYFLIKVSDNKFMLVGNDITIQHGDKLENVVDGFVEFVYLDGNIVRIKNQNLEIQNISSDLSINAGGNKLDLESKKLYHDDELKLNLGEITIDSDDNIDIVPDEINTTIDNPNLNDGSGNGSGNGGSGNGNGINNGNGDGDGSGEGGSGGGGRKNSTYTPNVNISGLKDGFVDTDIETQEIVVEKNVTAPDPEFNVETFIVSEYGVYAEIDVEPSPSDAVSIPPDSSFITSIVDVKRNQVVYTNSTSAGGKHISINDATSILNPDTNYAFVVHATYIKNDITYEKDFIQRTFVTHSVGVELEKTYVKTNGFGFKIKRADGSKIVKITYKIVNEDGEETEFGTEVTQTLSDEPISKSYEGTNIKSNTNYRVVVTSITNDDINGTQYADSFRDPIYLDIKTLKKDPTYPENSVVLVSNKQDSKFIFNLKNVRDDDSAIQEYRVDLYEAKTGRLVTSRTSNAMGAIEIYVDDGLVKRGTEYLANVVAVINDNEKIKEYEIGRTNVFSISGKQGPVAEISFDEITYEHASGTVTITDKNDTIDRNSDILLATQAVGIGIGEEEILTFQVSSNLPDDEHKYHLHFDFSGLRANTSYTITVNANVNYYERGNSNTTDGSNPYTQVTVATFNFDTKTPKGVTVAFSGMPDGMPEHQKGVRFNTYLHFERGSASGDYENEYNTLTGVLLWFYDREKYRAGDECTARHYCYQALLTDAADTPSLQKYVSYLSDSMYRLNGEESQLSKAIVINEYTFLNDPTYAAANTQLISNITAQSNYVLEVRKVYDYTNYKNEYPLEGTLKADFIMDSDANENPLVDVIVNPIYSDGNDNLLKGQTVVGYTVCPKIEGVLNPATDVLDFKLFNNESEQVDLAVIQDANNCISLKFNDNMVSANDKEKAHFYRGGSFKFSITLTRNHETFDPVTSTMLYPLKQAPYVYAYLSNRDSYRLYFGYDILDVDNSLCESATECEGVEPQHSFPIYVKAGTNGNEYKMACRPPNEGTYYDDLNDCIKLDGNREATTAVSGGSPIIATPSGLFDATSTEYPNLYVKVKLSYDSPSASVISNYRLYDGWQLERMMTTLTQDPAQQPKYVIQHTGTRNYINIILLSADTDSYWFRDKIVVYKLTFKGFKHSNYYDEVVLYKKKSDLKTIVVGTSTYYGFTIEHSEIAALKTVDDAIDITLSMDLFFDTQIAGFDSHEFVNNFEGFALEENVNGQRSYIFRDDSYIYQYPNGISGFENVNPPNLKLVSKYSDVQTDFIGCKRGTGGINCKDINGANGYLMLKVLKSYKVETSDCKGTTDINGASCDYSFMGDTPSFKLEKDDVKKGVREFSFKPDIRSTNPVKAVAYVLNASDVNIKTKTCPSSNPDCNTTCTFSYEDINECASLIWDVDGIYNEEQTIAGIDYSENSLHIVFKYYIEGISGIFDFDYYDYNFNSSGVYGSWFNESRTFPFYPIQTTSNPEISNFTAKYQYGGGKVNIYDRAFQLNFDLAYVSGFDGIEFRLYKKIDNAVYFDADIQPVEGAYRILDVPIDQLTEEGNEFYIDITPEYAGHSESCDEHCQQIVTNNTILTSNNYVVFAFPYYIKSVDGEDVKKTLSVDSIKSANVIEFVIPTPFVKVTLEPNSTFDAFGFKIQFSDVKGALGGYKYSNFYPNSILASSYPDYADQYAGAREARRQEAYAGKRYFYIAYLIDGDNETALPYNHSLPDSTKYPSISMQTSRTYGKDGANGVGGNNYLTCQSRNACAVRVDFYTDKNNNGLYEKESSKVTPLVLGDDFSYNNVSASVLPDRHTVQVLFSDVHGQDKARKVEATLYYVDTDNEEGGVFALYRNLGATSISFTDQGFLKYFLLDFGADLEPNTYYLSLNIMNDQNETVSYIDSLMLMVN